MLTAITLSTVDVRAAPRVERERRLYHNRNARDDVEDVSPDAPDRPDVLDELQKRVANARYELERCQRFNDDAATVRAAERLHLAEVHLASFCRKREAP
jgi:hypothetical protein